MKRKDGFADPASRKAKRKMFKKLGQYDKNKGFNFNKWRDQLKENITSGKAKHLKFEEKVRNDIYEQLVSKRTSIEKNFKKLGWNNKKTEKYLENWVNSMEKI